MRPRVLFFVLALLVLTLSGINIASSAPATALPPDDAPNAPNVQHALAYDAEDDYVVIRDGSNALNLGSAFTVEAWVRPDSVAGSGQYRGVVRGAYAEPPDVSGAWTMFVGNASYSVWGFSVCTPTCSAATSPAGNLTAGAWQHLAATYDGANIRIYRNGVLVDTQAKTGSVGTADLLIVGRWVLAFDGQIDELRLWNITRGQSDIQATMNYTVAPGEPGLVGSWHFDEGAGQTTADTVNQNNGRLGSLPVSDNQDPRWLDSTVPIRGPAPTSTPTATPDTCRPIASEEQIPDPGLIHFDDLPDATIIGDNYRPSHGVRFENGRTNRAIIYGQQPALAHSRPNFALNSAIFPTTSNNIPLRIAFDEPKKYVGMYIGNGENQKPTALLTAYDDKGNIICQVRRPGVTDPVEQFIGLADGQGRIMSLTLDYGDTALSEAIDDLYFSPYTPPTPTPSPTSTDTPVPTRTPSPTATDTPFPTRTPTPRPTETSEPTRTPIPTATDTSVPTRTPSPTPRPTETSEPTRTPSPTLRPTETAQPTATATQQLPITRTPTPTLTATQPVPTDQPTATRTLVPTWTPTRTPLPTWTPIPSPTATVGPTATATPIFHLIPYFPPVIATLVPFPVADLSIWGIEITQGIQCFDTSKGLSGCPDNSLPVVTKKNSTARIYLRYAGPAANQTNVPVRLYIRANNVWYEANGSGVAKKTLSQANADDSVDIYFNVNFTNNVTVDFYAVVDPNGAIAETNEGNNRFPSSGYITLNFQRRSTMNIVGRRTRYHPAGYTGTQYAGGWAVNGGAADWLEQLLPIQTGGINYSVASGYLDWTTAVSGGTSSQNSAGQHALISTLNLQWIQQNALSWLFGTGAFTGARHVYGWVDAQGYGGGHADMPVYPHAGGLGVVGIGTDNPGTSTDNPGSGALIFGHELVHDYNLKHTNRADSCGSSDDSTDFPYTTSSIQEFGYNPITGRIYDPSNTHDLMSYCPAGGSRNGWISPFTWNRMFSRLTPKYAGDTEYAKSESGAIFREAQADEESLVVHATIFNPALTAGGGRLGRLLRVAGGIEYPVPEGEYAIELRNGAAVLDRRTFHVSFESEYSAHTGDEPPGSPAPTTQADVMFIMPWATGTTTVVLLHGSQELDRRDVSPNVPTITITQPAGAEVWQAGSTHTISWQAADADGDSLTYTVMYSHDGGASWELLASDLTTRSFAVNTDDLAGGADTRFRVVATDGVNTAYDETNGPITIPNKLPVPTITDPVDNQVFAPGALVVLHGIAMDMEDGEIPEDRLHWSSDVQGSLGIGPSLPLTTLQPGPHVITLAATDSHGQTARATIRLFVGYRLYVPHLQQRAP